MTPAVCSKPAGSDSQTRVRSILGRSTSGSPAFLGPGHNKLATSSISWIDNRSPKAGIEFLPFVTWYLMRSTSYMPYCSSAAFCSVLSGCIAVLPPAWHAAQFPRKISWPFAKFGRANAGCAMQQPANTPKTMPRAKDLQAEGSTSEADVPEVMLPSNSKLRASASTLTVAALRRAAGPCDGAAKALARSKLEATATSSKLRNLDIPALLCIGARTRGRCVTGW
eukprot:CAMPEP_0183515412 /NCGR_PEP_ID=MMETSP0371-20130417/13517_1 /TAXON_ID=268820 /ORGANISM="Peridinium aciculiferum, Strain PAER-2" /LENGTH=223 /DNA_ID=CAMNT_0025712985 /DNA_START=261 /DNA_END=930 /DNA_ORIENTATION=+